MMSYLDQLREHCLAKDLATEDYPWGEVVWKVHGKMFAATGPTAQRVTVKSTLDKQAALIQHPDIEVASYVGRYGWVTVTFNSEDTFQLALDLIDESYLAVAKQKSKKPKV